MPPLNIHADVTSGAKGLDFTLSLHPHPYIVRANSEGSGESAHVRRLDRAFVAGQRVKYHLMCWLL